MATVTLGVVILIFVGSVTALDCAKNFTVTLDQVILPQPFPGDFFGISTRPDCTGTTLLLCNNDQLQVPIANGIYEDTSDSIDPSEFLAWNESSRITLLRAGAVDTLTAVRQVSLYFYHEPASGIGLPTFNLSASTSDLMPGDDILTYTILDNQDLTVDDAQVRNVTLVLTEPITEQVNRFHIEFFLSDSMKQFAVSEVQLCSDNVTIEAESLTLELKSEPLTGPNITLPANRTQVTAANMSLSCSVTNQGRFRWQWTSQGYSPQVSDDTRTSTIEIPLAVESVGEYTCTASYHPDTRLDPSPVTGTFTVDVERLLFTEENEMFIGNFNEITLECTLAGYVEQLTINEDLIRWTFNGQPLTTDSDYFISVGSKECPPYGMCSLSFLRILNLGSNDLGDYVCSFENLSQTITLLEGTSSMPTGSTSITPGTTGTTAAANNSLAPVIGGALGGIVVVLIIVVAAVIFVIYCMRNGAQKGSAILSSSNGHQYDEDPDALYTMIPKRDVPPPLPSRPIPGTYATVDSRDNGHIELKMIAPSLRDSIISMPAEVNAFQQDPALVKLSMTANNQNFPLRNNPLYSSADNLIQNAPPLPGRSFNSSTGNFDETNLNIYAIPHKPPPLPDRILSPELKEGTPTPSEKDTALTPAHFERDGTIGSPDSSSKVCPYASIYADPKPLLKEEGPIEVRSYHIKEVCLLGTGQFGEVILAETLGLSMRDLKLGDSTDKSVAIRVAAKRLKYDADKTVKETFEKEIKFMARLNHMNVIRLLAICPTGHPFILIEYMECGDLNQYLQKYEVAPHDTDPKENQIKVDTLLYACVQIANGMRYLASLHFIHRDLATRNCLVGRDNSIKIADFGMSRSLYSSHYYRIQGRAILPIRWMANECFYGRFSEKTDVWAFGVVMWEVFTLAKEQPYSSLSDQEVIENAVNTEEMKLLSKPEHCPEEVYEVMVQCWEKDPETRIDFEDVYSSLAALHSYSDM